MTSEPSSDSGSPPPASALAASRYRDVFDAAPDGLLIASPEGRLLDANPSACRAIGIARAELVGRDVRSLFDPALLQARPLPAGETLGAEPLRIEHRIVDSSGEQVPGEVSLGLLPDGNLLALLRGIGAQPPVEQRLQTIARGVSAVFGEAFFRVLAQHLCGALGADAAAALELVAGDVERLRPLAAWSGREALALDPWRLEGSAEEVVLHRQAAQCFADGAARRFPADARLSAHRVEGYAAAPLVDSGGRSIGVLVLWSRAPLAQAATWRSILEIFCVRAAAELERMRSESLTRTVNVNLEQRVRERTAELVAANRELESFSYSVSHDLRTPVRAIGGYARLLFGGYASRLDAAGIELLERIERAALRMGDLIDDLLALARAQRAVLVIERIDMARMARDAAEDVRGSDSGLPAPAIGVLPWASGDPKLLRLVWQNLLSNAYKFSRRSLPPHVQVSGLRRADGVVEYTVRDNGCGFDMAFSHKLFDIFQRLQAGDEYEGTGIGLAIVRRIVERHGGRVSASGTPGAGAAFTFELPG